MSITASNPCPTCNHYPDIPTDIEVCMWFSPPATWGPLPDPYEFFYCNRCGTKLFVGLTDEGIQHFIRDEYGSEDEFQREEGNNGPGSGMICHMQTSDDYLDTDYFVDLWQPPERRAFISYSHQDREWCSAFAEALRSRHYNVFHDNGSITPGADWVHAIEEAIENAHYFIIIVTPAAWASDWVQRELSMAFAAQRKIIPIMLSPTTIIGFLRSIQGIDAQNHTPEEAASIVVDKIQSMSK